MLRIVEPVPRQECGKRDSRPEQNPAEEAWIVDEYHRQSGAGNQRQSRRSVLPDRPSRQQQGGSPGKREPPTTAPLPSSISISARTLSAKTAPILAISLP
ncbi:hypothetical protein [Sphingomonas sp. CFBP 13706]|uniref:hypothetical protein n=1 Tax=Sphingomonas sp. CFBP 13706 TaxID=2775314 RepID=UPI001FD4E1BF|nr:hypothetical protein [Sphingomonas sp. CFBP 13706]